MPRLIAGIALVAVVASPAAAQEAPHRPIPNTFEEKTFTLPYNEFARLWLDGGATYRVEVEGTGISLRLAPIDEAHEPPLVKPLLLGRSPSGTALYTVRVRDSGFYNLTAVGGELGPDSGFYNLTAVGGELGRAVEVRITEDKNVPKDRPKRAMKDSGDGR